MVSKSTEELPGEQAVRLMPKHIACAEKVNQFVSALLVDFIRTIDTDNQNDAHCYEMDKPSVFKDIVQTQWQLDKARAAQRERLKVTLSTVEEEKLFHFLNVEIERRDTVTENNLARLHKTLVAECAKYRCPVLVSVLWKET